MVSEKYGEFIIEGDMGNKIGMLRIKRDGNGKLPNDLDGNFTSLNVARKMIDEYKRKLTPRVNAKN